jgi:hypothetical protein
MMSDQFGPVAMMVCFGAASRMAWRGRRLDARPAVGIVHLGLVHDLEEDYFGIAASVVGRQLSPQHHKPLHALVPVLHRLLVGSSGWMSIWTASPLANIASTTRSRRARKSALGPLPQWFIDCRVDAETHVVKPQFGHQGSVGVVGVTIGVFSRIIMGALRKPL